MLLNLDFKKVVNLHFSCVIISILPNPSAKFLSKSLKEIAPDILKGVDYVVNLHHEKKITKPSSIIKLRNGGIVKVIRE